MTFHSPTKMELNPTKMETGTLYGHMLLEIIKREFVSIWWPPMAVRSLKKEICFNMVAHYVRNANMFHVEHVLWDETSNLFQYGGQSLYIVQPYAQMRPFFASKRRAEGSYIDGYIYDANRHGIFIQCTEV